MVGFFDSGVGGLSILREVQKLLPAEDTVYFGDTAHVPYGSRSADEIITLSLQAAEFLIKQKSKLIVVACNTATSAAIQELRKRHATLPIVGVVPVMKTLAQHSRVKRVAVCATAATLSSNLYRRLKKEFAAGLEALELARPEWVEFVEAGDMKVPKLLESVVSTANTIRDFGADSVAFGCTHFAYLRSLMEQALPGVTLYDSGSAVARQVARVLAANQILAVTDQPGSETFFVSGNPTSFSTVASRLLERKVIAKKVVK